MQIVYGVMLLVVMVMLGTAAASTVAPPPRHEKSTPSFLAGQMQRSQVFLYTACTVFTIGIIYTAVWLRWPIELMPQGSLRDELSGHVTVVIAAHGVMATLIVLSTYLPMALVHRAQARALALEVLGDEHPPSD
jgi:hypothetical protein